MWQKAEEQLLPLGHENEANCEETWKTFLYDPVGQFLGIYLREMKLYVHIKIYP